MMAMLGYGDHDSIGDINFWNESIHPEDMEGVKRTMEYHLENRTRTYAIDYECDAQMESISGCPIVVAQSKMKQENQFFFLA